MTTGVSRRQLANYFGKSDGYFDSYRKCGVPIKKAGMLCKRLREFCMEYKDKSFEPVYIPSRKKRKLFAS
jgi:hypothetical protein